MRLRVVAVGQRMPSWVTEGFNEYAARFPRNLPLELREVAARKRSRNADIAAIRRAESDALLTAAGTGGRLVALDEGGRQWRTRELAGRLEEWMQAGRDVAFLIGGPDGLTDECRSRAELQWSLGRLTLPHPMVRLVLAEQLYRAWTITQNHPYHRA